MNTDPGLTREDFAIFANLRAPRAFVCAAESERRDVRVMAELPRALSPADFRRVTTRTEPQS